MKTWEAAMREAALGQLSAPVSVHHERACRETMHMLDGLSIRNALEVGCGEPPFLMLRLLRDADEVAGVS